MNLHAFWDTFKYCFISGFIGFILAWYKGRNGTKWIILSYIFVGVGPLLLACLPRVKKCPDCAEEIAAAANVCPHCRRNLRK